MRLHYPYLNIASYHENTDKSQKAASDGKVIEEIFAAFPSRFIQIYLEEIKWDKLWYDLPIHLDGLSIRVNSPMFHLYDRKLWRLLKDFFGHWNLATVRAGVSFSRWQQKWHRASRYERIRQRSCPSNYASVRKLFQKVRRTLSEMYSHIRQRYPDIDLDALGSQASKDAEQRMTEIREQIRKDAESASASAPDRQKRARKMVQPRGTRKNR